jgi:hypothetical protein
MTRARMVILGWKQASKTDSPMNPHGILPERPREMLIQEKSVQKRWCGGRNPPPSDNWLMLDPSLAESRTSRSY